MLQTSISQEGTLTKPMAGLHAFDLVITFFIQRWGDWLTLPMSAFTLLGSEQFYLLLMPTLYWCFDAALGVRIGLMLLLSNGFNTFFKIILRSPRPYWIDDRVKVLFQSETSFGLPSGHAQISASVWGVLAASLKKPANRLLIVAVIFLIGLSRIYLGVHFTSDVLLGWLIGGLLLLAFLKLEQPALAWFKHHAAFQQVLLGFALSMGMILLVLLPLQLVPDWQLPPAWQEMSSLTSPLSLVDPLNLEGIFTASGTIFGMIAGLVWIDQKYQGFNTSGTAAKRLLRFLLGMAGVLIFWYLLGQVLPDDAGLLALLLRYLRYALVGIWVSAGAPFLFIKTGLAQPVWAARVPFID